MKCARRLATVFLVLAVVLGTSSSTLAGSTTLSLSTNFTVVNLSDGPNQFVVTYWTETSPGTYQVTEATEQLDGIGAQLVFRQYMPPPGHETPEGPGSAVIASEKPVAAVVQVLGYRQNPTQRGAYTGFTQGYNKFFVPIAQRGNPTLSGIANSQIIVQNADMTDVDVTISLYKDDGTLTYVKTVTGLGPQKSYYYDLADESPSNLPAPWRGSAVIDATGNVAVVSNLFSGLSMQTFNCFAANSVGNIWFAPFFSSRLSTMDGPLSTPLAIQNVSDQVIGPGGITVTFYPRAGSGAAGPWTNANPVTPGASFFLNPAVDLSIPAEIAGSIVIQASSDVVAFVQMRATQTAMAAAYEAFRPQDASTDVIIPLVAKRLANGFSSSVVIQNTSSASVANVKLTYTPAKEYVDAGGSPEIITITGAIQPNENFQQNHRLPGTATPLPDRWQGSLRVESDVPVVAFVQLSSVQSINPALTGDTMQAYNAISMWGPSSH